MKSIIATLTCVCIVLAGGLIVEHQKRVVAEEQNARMEQQIKEISSQVNEIWNEYMGVMRRIQQHGNTALDR